LTNEGPLLRRLSPLAKGTLSLLGLALGVVGLAWFLSSEVAMLLCLVLLALGTSTCVAALLFAAKHGAKDAPGPWGISSRGWVSLAFLALAGGILGAQEAHLLGPFGLVTAAPNKSDTSPRETVPVGDAPSVWSMRKYEYPVPDSSDSSSERARLARDLAETRKKLNALEAGTRPERPKEKDTPAEKATLSSGGTSVVDLSQWHHKLDSPGPSSGTGPGTDDRKEKERLEKDLADLRKKIADLEVAQRPSGPQANNASDKPPTVMDLSKWHH
jgi:hypothetical protein